MKDLETPEQLKEALAGKQQVLNELFQQLQDADRKYQRIVEERRVQHEENRELSRSVERLRSELYMVLIEKSAIIHALEVVHYCISDLLTTLENVMEAPEDAKALVTTALERHDLLLEQSEELRVEKLRGEILQRVNNPHPDTEERKLLGSFAQEKHRGQCPSCEERAKAKEPSQVYQLAVDEETKARFWEDPVGSFSSLQPGQVLVHHTQDWPLGTEITITAAEESNEEIQAPDGCSPDNSES
jgi:hypothetical protein